jgi:hypothetical protein
MAANSPLGLPSSVDNSQTNGFPEIRTQPLNSCVSYATTYYAATYMTAMARGWNETTSDNSDKLSPAWTYDLVNGGADNGSGLYANYQVLLDNGAATWQEDPDDPSNMQLTIGNVLDDTPLCWTNEFHAVRCSVEAVNKPPAGLRQPSALGLRRLRQRPQDRRRNARPERRSDRVVYATSQPLR